MRLKSRMQFAKSSLAIAVAGALLSGCGGGGGEGSTSNSDNTPITTSRIQLSGLVTGRVADGYIMGATAFLDINSNKKLDTWEPRHKTEVIEGTATTLKSNTAVGKFSVNLESWLSGLSDKDYATMLSFLKAAGIDSTQALTAADLMAAFSVVVDIPKGAIDADKPTETISAPIQLAAPPKPKASASTPTEQTTFVSPITTVLDQKVTAKKKEIAKKEALGITVSAEEKKVDTLLSSAKKEVKADLKITSDNDDLLTTDYIATKQGTDSTEKANANLLHTVAKVTTTLLAKGVSDSTGTQSSALDEATKQAIIDAVTAKVIAQLTTIAKVSQQFVNDAGSNDVEIEKIDTTAITQTAQTVSSADSSISTNNLLEVSVSHDEIAAAEAELKELEEELAQIEQNQGAEPSQPASPDNSILVAFLNNDLKQIVLGTPADKLVYRTIALSQSSASWGESFTAQGDTLVLINGDWVKSTVTSTFDGANQTLSFTHSDSSEPIVLTRKFNGVVSDLKAKPMRPQLLGSHWQDKVTVGTLFGEGAQYANLYAEPADNPITLHLVDGLTVNGLTVSVDNNVVTFKQGDQLVESYLVDSVTAVDNAFTVPEDIAEDFNIPEDQRDWVIVNNAIGYQLGKSPVFYDWYNSTAFDQIIAQANNTDGLVSSPQLVASLTGDTVTIKLADLLVPTGWTLTSVKATKPALYGAGAEITVTNDQFTLNQNNTVKVELTYTSGSESFTEVGYVHRGKNTANNLVAGRDYKIKSKLIWNGSAYQHDVQLLLRNSRFDQLKGSTLSGLSSDSSLNLTTGIFSIDEDTPEFRSYRLKAEPGATLVFTSDSAQSITLPVAPASNPIDLSTASVSNLSNTGDKLSFTANIGDSAATTKVKQLCFTLSLSIGDVTETPVQCFGALSSNGQYNVNVDDLDLPVDAFESIRISGLRVDETIGGIEVSQTQSLSNAPLLLPVGLAETILESGQKHYFTAPDQSYLSVEYGGAGWLIVHVSAADVETKIESVSLVGDRIQFNLNGQSAELKGDATTNHLILAGQEQSLTAHNEESLKTWLTDRNKPKPYSSLFKTTPLTVATSSVCSAGGQLIESGFDLNDNKLLDANEVSFSQEICNGAESSLTIRTETLEGNTAECAGVGGSKLLISGLDPILLCNNDGTPRDYAKAETLVKGLGTWMSSLETYGQSAAQSVELQTNQLSSLVTSAGVERSTIALVTALQALATAYDQAIAGGATTFEVATLLPASERAYEVTGVSGNVGVDLQTNTLTLTGFSADVAVVESTGPVTESITVSADSISFPAQSGSQFSLSLANVLAQAGTGKMTVPKLEAVLTTANTVDLDSPDQVPGLLKMQLDFGTVEQPVRIETLGTDGGKEIVFTGALALSLEGEEKGYQIAPYMALNNASFAFNGELSFDNQTLAVNLGLDVPKLYQLDPFPNEEILSDLKVGDTLSNWITVEAIDGTNYQSSLPFEPEQVNELKLYKFTSKTSYVRYKAIAVYPTAIKVYDVYPSFDGSGYNFNGYGGLYASIKDAEIAAIRDAIGLWSLIDLNTPSYLQVSLTDSTGNPSVRLMGSLDVSLGLPEVGVPKGYSFKVNSLDSVNSGYPMTNFDNHSQYTAIAGIKLGAIQDVNGNTLPDAELKVKAERSGYAYQYRGGVSFSLIYDGANFTARYNHSDLLSSMVSGSYNQYDNDPLRDAPVDFSFTDNAGGLVKLELNDNSNYNCQYQTYSGPREISCLLGAYYFRIYYNGVDHGYMYQDYMKGDWIAVFGDKDENVENYELRIFQNNQ